MSFGPNAQFTEDNNGLRLVLSNGATVPVALHINLDANGNDPANGLGSASNPQYFNLAPSANPQIAKITVTGKTGHVAGGAFAWVAPYDCIIHRVLSRVRTVASGVCLLDAGTTAVSAATLSDNLLDGSNLQTASALYDSAAPSGSAKTSQFAASGTWVTGSAQDASSDLTGFVGDVYIVYSQV